MPTIVFTCGGEAASEPGTTSHWSSTSGTVTKDTTHVRSGTNALKMLAAGDSKVTHTLSAGQRGLVARFSVWVPSTPAGNNTILQWDDGVLSRYLYRDPDTFIWFDFQKSLLPLPLDQWVTIDIKLNTTADPHVWDWRINGVDQTQKTRAGAASDIVSISFQSENTGLDCWFDDIAISYTAGDYPIGPGASLGSPEVWTPADSYSYRPVIASNNRVGPRSLRRRARHVIYATDVAGAAPQNLQLTAADAITVGDAVVRVVTNNRTASDSIATTESVARALTLSRTTGDALTVGDSVSRSGSTFLRTASDSLTIAESVAALRITPRTASDSITVADSVARQVTLNRTTSDSITVADSVARTVTNLRTTADALTVGDSVARVLTLFRTAADSISVGNTVARVVTNLRTAADSIGIADSVARVLSLLRTAADSITIAESVAGLKVNARTAADSLSISDTVTRTLTLLRTAADALTITESVARVVSLFRTASDSVTISESVTGSVTHGGQTVNVTASDSLTVADTLTRQVTNNRTAADSVSIAESVAQSTISFGTLSDSVTVGNTVARVLSLFRTVSDSITISDQVTVTINGVPIVPSGAGHKGPTFLGRLEPPKPRRRQERVRVPLVLAMEARDTLRIRTTVSAVVDFNDDEDAIALLVLAGALS